MIRQHQPRRTPATRPTPILVADPLVPPQFEGNSMFLQSPTATAMRRETDALGRARSPTRSDSDCAEPNGVVSSSRVPNRLASPGSAAPYVSLYDRLAQANGIKPSATAPLVVPTARATPLHGPNTVEAKPESAQHGPSKQRVSSVPERHHGSSKPPLQSHNERIRAPERSVPTSNNSRCIPQHSTPMSHTTAMEYVAPATQPIVLFPPSPPVSISPQLRSVPISAPQTVPGSLDSKQQNVLHVIQNLIQHKKQTLATLARQPPDSATILYS
ncbi:hypothetical protein PINS_up001324 [Pythium insidiosum]|nr:hypothetical protein PINS_up001324 [Pythium insidiosum]